MNSFLQIYTLNIISSQQMITSNLTFLENCNIDIQIRVSCLKEKKTLVPSTFLFLDGILTNSPCSSDSQVLSWRLFAAVLFALYFYWNTWHILKAFPTFSCSKSLITHGVTNNLFVIMFTLFQRALNSRSLCHYL